jgi:hypothetical protein
MCHPADVGIMVLIVFGVCLLAAFLANSLT